MVRSKVYKTHAKVPQQNLILAGLLTAAFLVRLGVRVSFGEEYFWSNSYVLYYDLAENILSGSGFCLKTRCAWLTPVYPMFLALTALAGKSYLFIIVPQAILGAGTALCAFLIGRDVFNASVGILACGIIAFYPYYVMHDTALQETGMATFFAALSVWLLLRASRRDRNRDWFLAGLMLGTLILVRASMAPIVGAALFWCAIWGTEGNAADRLQNCLGVFLAVAVVIAPWLIYTYHMTGAPVLNSQMGRALWMGNNSETFSRYPTESIDRSRDEAWSKFTETDKAELLRVQHDEIATSRWFAHRAFVYIDENPLMFFKGAFRKIGAGFSWRLNPHREPLAQAVYAIGYVPIAALGIVGMFLVWRSREGILIALLFLAFLCVAAIFWSHTSHRSFLDIYLVVLASSVIFEGWVTLPHVRESQ